MSASKLIDHSVFTIENSSGRLSLISLSIPLFFQNVFNVLLGTVNTLMLTKVSDDAVTAVNVANTVIDIPITILNMVTNGTLIIISLFLGAAKRKEADKVITTGLAATALFSFAVSLFFCLTAAPVLSLMNLDGEILNSAALYFKIRMVFLCFTGFTNCLTAVMRAHGYALPTLISGLSSNAVNALLSIFVVSPYFSGDKIAGVAYAAVIGQLVGMIYSALSIVFKKDIPLFSGLSLKCFKKIVGVGVPSGISLFAFTVSAAISTSVVASLGQTAINTKIYTYSISRYTYLLGYAFAQAACILIGRYAGMGEYQKAKTLFTSVRRIIIAIDALFSLSVFLFSTPLIRFFTSDPTIISTAKYIFLIDIAIEMARGNNHMADNALCSVADTLFTSSVSIASCICLSAFGCWFFCIKLNMGIFGYFAASFIDELFRGTLYYIRWCKGKWMLSVQTKIS